MTRQRPIAIIGVGCRLPGVPAFRDMAALLKSGQTAIAPIPHSRWALSTANTDTDMGLRNPQAGLIGDVAGLDRTCFGISANEAPMVDPLQRLFLETSWHALEHAGLSPADQKGRDIGVFAGVSQSEYALLQAEAGFPATGNPYLNTGCAASVVAGRVAYCLGLTGPVQSIDTACASALSAVASACDALMSGQCTSALAGGAHVILSKKVMQSLSSMGVLSPSGAHRCFDQKADGFVRGEGCGVVVLKPLSAARADGDHIYAVIEGWGQRHNGRTNGLSAPSRAAQAASISAVLTRAGVTPAEVAFVEGHGSATKLGDTMEAGAVQDALAAVSGKEVSLGSAKAVFGHLEAAAGIAGLIKVTAMLQEGFIPPQAGFDEINDAVARAAPDVIIDRKVRDWAGQSRKSIVSALGYNGACVHAVVSNGPDPHIEARQEPGLFLISAACPAALQLRLEHLKTLLKSAAQGVRVGDIARAISQRWDGMTYRVSLYGLSRQAVIDQIDAHLAATLGSKPRARMGTTLGLTADHSGWSPIIAALPPPFQDQDIKGVFAKMGLDVAADGGEVIAVPDPQRAGENQIALPQTDDRMSDLFVLIGRLWERGVKIDQTVLWSGGAAATPLDIPGYPFQRIPAWNLPQDVSAAP